VFVLGAANSYSGVTTIATGTGLAIDDGGTTATLGTGAVVDNGSLGFARSDAVTVTNDISGSGSVSQFAGALTLTGDNTYTGGTTVASGTLIAGGNHSLGTNSAVTVVSGATLDLNGFSVSIGTLSGAGTVNNSATGSANLAVASNVNSTFSGVIENTGADLFLLKNGSGAFTLTGANTYGGGTGVDGGTLQIGNGGTTGTLGAGAVAVANSGVLAFDRSDGAAISQTISGGGSVSFSGGGAFALLGNNSYSGVTTITSGSSLLVGEDTTTGTLGTGAVDDNGVLVFANSGADNVVADAISGTGSIDQKFGRTVLTGNNSYTGGTIIGVGALSVSGTGTLGTGAVTDNSVLEFSRSDTITAASTVANAISGTGAVDQLSGVTILTGNNSYSGATVIFLGGELAIGDDTTTGTLGTGAVLDNGAFFSPAKTPSP
jgi:autotransporter-associated beta strand protein